MERPAHLMTPLVLQLLSENMALKPQNTISFQKMTDQDLLKRSAGAAIITDQYGNELVYWDPVRIDEHAILHELMHSNLHRSGWPQVYSMIGDKFPDILAMKIDNLIDHYLFNSQFPHIEIDNSQYKEEFTSNFSKWTRSEDKALDILHNALDACEGFLLGETYRDRAIDILRSNYQESLDLALKFEEILKSRSVDKINIRKTAVSLIDLANEWVQKENKEVPNLRRIIGLSPLFTPQQLSKRAQKYVHFKSERMVIQNHLRYIAFFFLKSDDTRFRTFISSDNKEPEDISEIRRSWQTGILKELLESQNINYGVI